MKRLRSLCMGVVLLGVSACIWLPCMHVLFKRDVERYRTSSGLSPVARQLSAAYLAICDGRSLPPSDSVRCLTCSGPYGTEEG
jgi:hypothetical protein